jgi:RNA polymerase sigma-70 factor (sigma-E family)
MRPAWESDFVDFYQARGAALRRTAYLLCGDFHAAEDLVQAAFVKLYVAWPRVRIASAEAYARRVLVRTFVAERRLRRSRELPMAALPAELLPETAGPEADHPGRLDVLLALAALPARQRAVVVLRFWEDLSVEETAGLLGISEGTVKSHCARAVAALRACVEPVAEAG